MNIFIISPGRTATTHLARVFEGVSGFTSLHESRVEYLGLEERVSYPRNHIEADNRLIWYLRFLERKYADRSCLVIVKRDRGKIVDSYAKRWYKTNILRAWTQGIHMLDIGVHSTSAVESYVDYCYESLSMSAPKWKHVIELDIAQPNQGIEKLCELIGASKMDTEAVVKGFQEGTSNLNKKSLKQLFVIIKWSVRQLYTDVKLWFQS